MDTDGGSPEIEKLHEAWSAFERELWEAGLEPGRCGAVLSRFYRYRNEAVAYRLSTVDVVEELRLQVKTSYYKSLRPEWFAELDSHEIIELLPVLVPASMHWDPSGNGPLLDFVNVALDALPRELAKKVYLEAFTKYLRGFGYYGRATPEERPRILREYMWLNGLHIYHSATARENSEELQNILRDLLGEEAVPLYQQGLAEAQEGEPC